jgi:hypothetical protein
LGVELLGVADSALLLAGKLARRPVMQAHPALLLGQGQHIRLHSKAHLTAKGSSLSSAEESLSPELVSESVSEVAVGDAAAAAVLRVLVAFCGVLFGFLCGCSAGW